MKTIVLYTGEESRRKRKTVSKCLWIYIVCDVMWDKAYFCNSWDKCYLPLSADAVFSVIFLEVYRLVHGFRKDTEYPKVGLISKLSVVISTNNVYTISSHSPIFQDFSVRFLRFPRRSHFSNWQAWFFPSSWYVRNKCTANE